MYVYLNKFFILLIISFFVNYAVAQQGVDKKKDKELELKNQAEAKQLAWEKKIKEDEQTRKNEFDIAIDEGTEALVKFADKWPNTEESKKALRILEKYGAENNVLERKIYFEDSFYWIAKGDRDWLNEFKENNRNWIKGGDKFNLFVFAKLHNRTDKKITADVTVNFNLISTSHVLIFYSQNENILTEHYFIELEPLETKPMIVIFKNVGGGTQYGNNLFLSAGSSNDINPNNPFDITFKYYNGKISQGIINRQNDLLNIVQKNAGNITVQKNGKDNLTEKLDKWFGIDSEQFAELHIYFTKKSSSNEELKIYDKSGNVVRRDNFSSSGPKNPYYNLLANKNYKVFIPSYGEFEVYVKRRLTHLKIKGAGNSNVSYDE